MKKAISAFLCILIIALAVPYSAFAVDSDEFMSNPHFKQPEVSEIDAKFNNGDKFIVFGFRTDCWYSRNVGTDVLTQWMADGVDIYAFQVDGAWPKFAPNYVSGSVYLPLVFFVENGTVALYSMTDSNSLEELESRLRDEYDSRYSVSAENVSSVSVRTLPDKTNYVVGDSFRAGGLSIDVTYKDGSKRIIRSGYEVKDFSSVTAGSKTLTVKFGGKTANFNVYVNPEGSKNTYSYNVDFKQTEARKMLDMVNKLRTGTDAWYWNESNTQKIYCSGLKAFSYDYELEQVAMQRCAELASNYGHIRPNDERISDIMIGKWNRCGENIALGFKTAAEMENAFEESDADYKGQGHRRNLLSGDYTAVAFACCEVNGVKYWAQAFRAPVSSAAKTEPCDSTKAMNVEILEKYIISKSMASAVNSLTVTEGDSVELPAITGKMTSDYAHTSEKELIVTPVWSSDNTSAAEISSGRIVAKKAGTAKLTASYNGMTAVVNVTVEKGEIIAPPSDVTAVTDGDNKVSLSWNPVPGAAYYKVYRRDGASGSYNYKGAVYSAAFSDSGLKGGTEYFYRIAAVVSDSAGEHIGEYSEEISVKATGSGGVCEHTGTETISGKPASCEADGYTDKIVCSGCGTVIAESEKIPAKGHSYEWVYNNDATAEADGTETQVCTRCKAKGDTRVKPGTRQGANIGATVKTAGAVSFDYGTKITVAATASGIDAGYHLEMEIGGKTYKGDRSQVRSGEIELKSSINYTVKVVKDSSGAEQKELTKQGGTITCKGGLLKQIIAFFRSLFGLTKKETVQP